MNIKSIEIKNYKSIKNLKVNFFNNKNGIETDLKLGTFKLTPNHKHAIPAFNIIVGRNAIGKTTILEAIGIIVNTINGNIKNLISQLVIDKLYTFNNFISNNKINPLVDENLHLIEEIQNAANNSNNRYFKQWQIEKKEFFKTLHKTYSYTKDKDISIKMCLFHTKEKDQKIEILITQEGLLNIVYEQNATNKDKELINRFIKKIHCPSSSYRIKNNLNFVKDIRQSINNVDILTRNLILLEENMGEEKLLNLLQLADPSIKKIVTLKHQNGWKIIEKIILDFGEVSIIDLSTGTKHFIVLLCVILSPHIFEKYDSLILIDELELSLHNELNDALKMLMIEMFEKYNTNYIFTTHNPLLLRNLTSYKQIISLDYDEDENLTAKTMSSILKPNSSIIRAYESGLVAPYPDIDKARKIISKILEPNE